MEEEKSALRVVADDNVLQTKTAQSAEGYLFSSPEKKIRVARRHARYSRGGKGEREMDTQCYIVLVIFSASFNGFCLSLSVRASIGDRIDIGVFADQLDWFSARERCIDAGYNNLDDAKLMSAIHVAVTQILQEEWSDLGLFTFWTSFHRPHHDSTDWYQPGCQVTAKVNVAYAPDEQCIAVNFSDDYQTQNHTAEVCTTPRPFVCIARLGPAVWIATNMYHVTDYPPTCTKVVSVQPDEGLCKKACAFNCVAYSYSLSTKACDTFILASNKAYSDVIVQPYNDFQLRTVGKRGMDVTFHPPAVLSNPTPQTALPMFPCQIDSTLMTSSPESATPPSSQTTQASISTTPSSVPTETMSVTTTTLIYSSPILSIPASPVTATPSPPSGSTTPLSGSTTSFLYTTEPVSDSLSTLLDSTTPASVSATPSSDMTSVSTYFTDDPETTTAYQPFRIAITGFARKMSRTEVHVFMKPGTLFDALATCDSELVGWLAYFDDSPNTYLTDRVSELLSENGAYPNVSLWQPVFLQESSASLAHWYGLGCDIVYDVNDQGGECVFTFFKETHLEPKRYSANCSERHPFACAKHTGLITFTEYQGYGYMYETPSEDGYVRERQVSDRSDCKSLCLASESCVSASAHPFGTGVTCFVLFADTGVQVLQYNISQNDDATHFVKNGLMGYFYPDDGSYTIQTNSPSIDFPDCTTTTPYSTTPATTVSQTTDTSYDTTYTSTTTTTPYSTTPATTISQTTDTSFDTTSTSTTTTTPYSTTPATALSQSTDTSYDTTSTLTTTTSTPYSTTPATTLSQSTDISHDTSSTSTTDSISTSIPLTDPGTTPASSDSTYPATTDAPTEGTPFATQSVATGTGAAVASTTLTPAPTPYPPTPNSTPPNFCQCQIDSSFCSKISSVNQVPLHKVLENIVANLTVDKTTTSSYKRRLISAEDVRRSSSYIGGGAIVFLSLFTSVIILPDVANLATAITNRLRA